jgi:hypothetical protein
MIVGSVSAFNGTSTITQTFVIPAGATTLSFWLQPHCPDTFAYDQQTALIRNTAGATLATVMNYCSNSGVWTRATYDVRPFAGQNIVLYFAVHDDGYPTDPTYMYLDDVSVT